MEDADCGAACLAIVLAFYGRRAELHELREQCSIGRDGVSAAALKHAASLHHLELTARRVMVWSEPDGTVRLDQVCALPVPALVFLDGRHLAVLEGVRGGMVLLNDPAVGHVRMPAAEFARRFGQIALLLAPAAGFQRGGVRFPFVLSLGRRVRPYLGVLGAAIAVGLIGAVPAVVASLALRSFLVRVLGVGDAAWRVPTVVILSGAVAFVMVVSWTQQRLSSRVLADMTVRWATRYLWRMVRLPGEFFHRRNIGGLVTRLHMNDGLAVALSERLITVAVALTTAVAYLTILLLLNPALGVTALFIGAVNAVVLRAAAARAAPHQNQLLGEMYQRDGLAFNGLRMIETVKADGAEDWLFGRWAALQAQALQTTQRLAEATQTLLVLPNMMSTVAVTAAAVVGGIQLDHGAVSLPTFLIGQLMLAGFLGSATSLALVGEEFNRTRSQATVLDDVLKAIPERRSAGPSVLSESVSRLSGRIELVDVTFGYNRWAEPLLRAISLTVEPGCRVAFVGQSGSGKSTLARLIVGALRPWSGEILFDGRPRDILPRELLCTDVGYVEQELRLFQGSVRDNVTLWDATAPGDAVGRALRDAQASSVVERRGGLDAAWIREQAANLSGGERQRLEIARALVLDPPVLVLDEATSALDPDTESAVDAAIRERRCTCVVIAHRLSTVRDSDLIVVLEEGRVVQQGLHDDLIATQGPYRRLVMEQQ